MKKNTILIVDDREDDILLLKRMFHKACILNHTQTVGTVTDAICYLKGKGIYQDREAHPFPILLILDLHLPDGTGFDVLRWINANQSDSPLAVVVLSGSDVGAIRESYQLGAHSFLTKPLRFEDFQNMVNHARSLKLAAIPEGYHLESA